MNIFEKCYHICGTWVHLHTYHTGVTEILQDLPVIKQLVIESTILSIVSSKNDFYFVKHTQSFIITWSNENLTKYNNLSAKTCIQVSDNVSNMKEKIQTSKDFFISVDISLPCPFSFQINVQKMSLGILLVNNCWLPHIIPCPCLFL